MTKKDQTTEHRSLATRMVDHFATHEKAEVDDTTKDFKVDPEIEEPIFEKTTHHVYRFTGLGLNLVGADKNKDTAKAEVVDLLAKMLDDGDLVLSDTWAEDNLGA